MLKEQRLGRRLVLVGLALMALETSFHGKAMAGFQEAADFRIDREVSRREIQDFEALMNGVINTMFSASPFALVQKPKGVYLQGYGVAFNFLINIHRAVFDTPFGQLRRGNEITPDVKKRRIEELKEKMIHLLIDNGDGLKQLRKEEAVTIVAFLEDRNFPDEPNENKTIVMTAFKKDLDELAHKDDRLKEFKQRMKIVEY